MQEDKAITIVFKTIEEFKSEIFEAVRSGVPSIGKKGECTFQSPQTFRNFMTLQKLELIGLIAYSRPASIYDLAKMAGRPLSAVQRDCNALHVSGFIKLRKRKSARGAKVPMLKFEYNRIIVQLPDHPYSLKIEVA